MPDPGGRRSRGGLGASRLGVSDLCGRSSSEVSLGGAAPDIGGRRSSGQGDPGPAGSRGGSAVGRREAGGPWPAGSRGGARADREDEVVPRGSKADARELAGAGAGSSR